MKVEKLNKPQLQKVQDDILAIKVGMLVTKSIVGEKLYARPMQTQLMDADGCIWFFSSKHTDKDHEISQGAKVNVAYADSNSSSYVSVSGTAHIVEDKEKMEDLWSPIMKAWYPDGIDTPGITLLKIDIDSAAYWDSSANKMVEMFEIAKAVVTGDVYDGGEHAKVNG